MRDRGKSTIYAVATLWIASAVVSGAIWAQDAGICVSAHVEEAFRLPDGSLHEAGRLTLCAHRALNPVVGLHRIWRDAEGVQLAMSRRAVAEARPDSRPEILFRCAPGEPLDLVGYVVPGGRMAWSYALRRTPTVATIPSRSDGEASSTPHGHASSGVRSIPAELAP